MISGLGRFLLLLSFLGLPASALTSADSIGTLMLIRGAVTARKIGGEKAPVSVGEKFFVGDVLETGKTAGAQVVLEGGCLINLSSDTALRVNQYAFDPGKRRRTGAIRLMAGKARFVVPAATNGESSFKVEAGHASTAATAGDFVVIALPRETTVAVLGGKVSVKNSSHLTVGRVTLGMNQTTSVREKTPPSGPEIISREQRRIYRKDAHNF